MSSVGRPRILCGRVVLPGEPSIGSFVTSLGVLFYTTLRNWIRITERVWWFVEGELVLGVIGLG
jgi:hypothetical protein